MGNKCDIDEHKRVVSYSKGQALANEFGIKFFETSAKSNINVDEVRPAARAALAALESCGTLPSARFRLQVMWRCLPACCTPGALGPEPSFLTPKP